MSSLDKDIERLAPTLSTLRRLYSLSGNLCAYNFGGTFCNNLLFDPSGQFIGEVCHIEAAKENGQRFNPDMTNEQRRSFENLILLCTNHHKITDNVATYTVDVLKQMKENHEKKFSTDLLIERILAELKDFSKGTEFKKVENLNNLFQTLYPDNKFPRKVEEIKIESKLFNTAIEKYIKLSLPTRKIFAIGLHRAHFEYNSYRNTSDTLYVDVKEIINAMGGYSKERQIMSSFKEAIAHKLMFLKDDVETSEDVLEPMLCYHITQIKDDELDVWLLLKRYCQKKRIEVETFLGNLDFSELDN